MPSVDQPRRRIFFALWPDNKTRSELNHHLAPLLTEQGTDGAKRVPVKNWHITLAFVGNVTEQVFAGMIEQVNKMQALPAFDLRLDSLGYWKKPRVAWLGCSSIPDALLRLVSELNAALAPCGYRPDYPGFTPHLTLLRKARQKLSSDRAIEIDWPVAEFVLVESILSQAGSRYTVIRRWPLG